MSGRKKRGPGLRTICQERMDKAVARKEAINDAFLKIEPPYSKEDVQLVMEWNYNQGLITAYGNVLAFARGE